MSSSLEQQLRGILKYHGFHIAADAIDARVIPKKTIRDKIASWSNYPRCMDIYPQTLSPKSYDEETTMYVKL